MLITPPHLGVDKMSCWWIHVQDKRYLRKFLRYFFFLEIPFMKYFAGFIFVIYLSIYLSIYQSNYLSISLSVYLSPIYQISCYTWKELETDLVNPEYQQNIWCLTISEPRSSKMKKENHCLAFLSIFNPNNTNLFSTVCTAWRN